MFSGLMLSWFVLSCFGFCRFGLVCFRLSCFGLDRLVLCGLLLSCSCRFFNSLNCFSRLLFGRCWCGRRFRGNSSRRGFNSSRSCCRRFSLMIGRLVSFDDLDNLDSAGNFLTGNTLHGHGRTGEVFWFPGRRLGNRRLFFDGRFFSFRLVFFFGLLRQAVPTDETCSEPGS